MARNLRLDPPGSWHHVMNRSIARRSLFETRDDIRYFQACLARAVRRGQIEVHAWCVLTTHFRLLVRSPVGELSQAMRRVQNAYVRRFNRGRKRDGPLVRGRFRSKRVDSVEYRAVLVRYIDGNPVHAGLVDDPCDYPHGSARAYTSCAGPRWLSREWVEGLVCRRLGQARYEGRPYSKAFLGLSGSDVRGLVERRRKCPERQQSSDELDHLIEAAPERVLRWLQRKADLADGGNFGAAVSDPHSIQRAVSRGRGRLDAWMVDVNRKTRCGWDSVEAGLLRDMSAATYHEVGAMMERPEATAARLHAQRRNLLARDPEYARIAAGLVREVLERTLGR